MKLVGTTDEEYINNIGEECEFTYRGYDINISLDHTEIWEKSIKQITREGNRVVIMTENNTYTLED